MNLRSFKTPEGLELQVKRLCTGRFKFKYLKNRWIAKEEARTQDLHLQNYFEQALVYLFSLQLQFWPKKAFSHKMFTLPIIPFVFSNCFYFFLTTTGWQFIVSANDNYIAQCSALTYRSYKTSGMAEMAALTDTFGNGDSCNNTDHVQK